MELIIESRVLSIYDVTEPDLTDYENGDLLLIVHSPYASRFVPVGLPKGETYREYIGSYLTATNVPVTDNPIYYGTDVLFIIKLADGTEDDIIFIERESDGSNDVAVY